MRRTRGLRVSTALGLALLVSAMVGCRGHTQLAAPAATADIEQRLAAYERLRGTELHRTHVYYGGRYSTTRADYFKLADGTYIDHPEDLLPVVPADSRTATAAKEAHSEEAAAQGWFWAWIGCTVASSVIIMSPLVADDLSMTGPSLWIGSGLTAIGMVGGIMGIVKHRSANRQAATAYENYNEDLRRRLNLCVEDDTVFGCDIGLACEPACRAGYKCVSGTCVSRCNPPCPAGTVCAGDGAQATCQPAPGPRR